VVDDSTPHHVFEQLICHTIIDQNKNKNKFKTSTTMMTGGPLQVVSNADREALAQARIKAVKTRPSTLAAQEFFSGDRTWKSLPRRVQLMVDVFESWVRCFHCLFK
jgi:hypothetical protein